MGEGGGRGDQAKEAIGSSASGPKEAGLPGMDKIKEAITDLISSGDEKDRERLLDRFTGILAGSIARYLAERAELGLMPAQSQPGSERDKDLMARTAERAYHIQNQTGEPVQEVLFKAMSLYNTALEAERAGNRVAILSPDDEIIREIRGFAPAQEPVRPKDDR